MHQQYQCRSFAGLAFTHAIRRLYQFLQFRSRVVGCGVTIAMAKQYFPRFQVHTCGPQSTSKRMLEIVHSNRQVQS